MYLNLLNEEQKKCFLDYAHKLASVDGHYSNSEEEMLKAYCDEMCVSFEVDTNGESVEELLEKFNKISEECGKKIFLFEAIGLALVDNKFDEAELKMLKTTREKFGLEESFATSCKKYIEEYIQLQNQINAIVIGV